MARPAARESIRLALFNFRVEQFRSLSSEATPEPHVRPEEAPWQFNRYAKREGGREEEGNARTNPRESALLVAEEFTSREFKYIR